MLSVTEILTATLLLAGLLLFIADKKKAAILLLAAGGAIAVASFIGCTEGPSQGQLLRDEADLNWPESTRVEASPSASATLKVERGWVAITYANGESYAWRVDSVVYKEWNDATEYNRQECTAIISENKTDRRWHRYGLVIIGES